MPTLFAPDPPVTLEKMRWMLKMMQERRMTMMMPAAVGVVVVVGDDRRLPTLAVQLVDAAGPWGPMAALLPSSGSSRWRRVL